MTTGQDGREELCRTCQNSRAWHEEHQPLHPFNNGEAGATAFLRRGARNGNPAPQRDAGPVQMSLPFDPVLRQALIDAGVITPRDLTVAEEKIRSVTAGILGGNLWSATKEGSSDSSTEIGRTSTELSSERESPRQ